MLSRQACPDCDVLETADYGARCWMCGGPMIHAYKYRTPTSRHAVAEVPQ